MQKFSVSIKGILKVNGKYLLRKNERNEFELLGGKLEKSDISAPERLIQEFLEESGIQIKVISPREPWLYEIGYSNIIIVPYVCEADYIPSNLYDNDGGQLIWVDEKQINSLFMPQGYKDSIQGNIPHKSYSIPAKKFFKIIPNYVEKNYFIYITVYSDEKILFEKKLEHFNSPRDFIYKHLGEVYKNFTLESNCISIDQDLDAIKLNYTLK